MSKMSIYDKILSPVVTEKSTNLSELNKIVFIPMLRFENAGIVLAKTNAVNANIGI